MNVSIKKGIPQFGAENIIILAQPADKWKTYKFSKEEIAYISGQIKEDKKSVEINRFSHWCFIQVIDENSKKAEPYKVLESARKAGDRLCSRLNSLKIPSVTIVADEISPEATLAFLEGMILGNYQFLKYRKDAVKEKNILAKAELAGGTVSEKQLKDLTFVTEGTCRARDLVNEPVIYLTATQLSREFQKMGKEAGFSVEVLTKAKIETLKMGGLLAVNYGSVEPPTFTIMEWKPKKVKNKKPIVLVGKGVVYDTGGLSLKPTPNSMDTMKCDMAGAAAVAGAMYAISKSRIPLHVIALVPATDNRPGGNAYTPGDVIRMHSGLTVEVLNTDAEGRMILADALSYAQRYKPQLVMDFATLTGAAVAAIGYFGTVCMGNADEATKKRMK